MNVICPDQKSECPTDQTCCLSSEGTYNCCPAPHAVCCKDGKHCCYSGQVCNEATGTCENKTKAYVSLSATKRRPRAICPDSKTQCDYKNTCCMELDSKWGCCPLPNAVCCMDGKHCCPEGTKCDLTKGTCIETVSPLQLEATTRGSYRPHPHHKCMPGFCSRSQTCCATGTGSFACCPISNGVCCHGAQYCCHEGSECNEIDGSCDTRWNAAAILKDGGLEKYRKMIPLFKRKSSTL